MRSVTCLSLLTRLLDVDSLKLHKFALSKIPFTSAGSIRPGKEIFLKATILSFFLISCRRRGSSYQMQLPKGSEGGINYSKVRIEISSHQIRTQLLEGITSIFKYSTIRARRRVPCLTVPNFLFDSLLGNNTNCYSFSTIPPNSTNTVNISADTVR
jgi:hypothetical protein